MKNVLAKKLLSYSGLASSIMIMPRHAQSQIVYTNPKDSSITAETPGFYNIDMNGDGVSDFAFYHGVNGFEIISAYLPTLFNSVLARHQYCNSSFYSSRDVLALHKRYTIGAGAGAWENFGGDYFNFLLYNPDKDASCNEPWAGAGNKFIGVRFLKEGTRKYYYGWIRASLSTDAKTLTIRDWAYNAQLNAPILAGQHAPIESRNEFASEEDVNPIKISSHDRTIAFLDNFSNEKITIGVYNVMGKLIQSFTTQNALGEFSLQDIPAGIYIVNVSGKEINASEKILIQ